MGNCGCSGDSNEIDAYLKKHHKGNMKIEQNIYELAKQDRSENVKNLKMGQSDLANYIQKAQGGSKAGFQDGDKDGADGEGKASDNNEIDEELLREMCNFTNLSNSNGAKLQGGFNAVCRTESQTKSLMTTKKVVEDYDLTLDADIGEGGRPRFREEIKLPPQYDIIDLNDPNDEVLFQGELSKYKAALNPTFITRWVQVTEKGFKYFKGRCNAITCCNKPLLAIPVAAIKKVERVNFDLPINKKEREKLSLITGNQFEIFLKDDFIDIFLRPDYDLRLSCNHIHKQNEQSIGSPQKASNFGTNSQSMSIQVDRASSDKKRGQSPMKVRGIGAESHPMTAEEMKARFYHLEEGQRLSNLQDKITQSVNTYGSWSNREEEWYFTNKRLLFTTKSAEISDQWVEKLNALVTDP